MKNKALSTITSEIILTLMTIVLITPLLVYFGTLNNVSIGTGTESQFMLLLCITYKYINETTIILYNNCAKNIQLYSILNTNTSMRMFYYNISTNTLEETKTIYAKGLHLIVVNRPFTKVALNTSEGILIIER